MQDPTQWAETEAALREAAQAWKQGLKRIGDLLVAGRSAGAPVAAWRLMLLAILRAARHDHGRRALGAGRVRR